VLLHISLERSGFFASVDMLKQIAKPLRPRTRSSRRGSREYSRIDFLDKLRKDRCHLIQPAGVMRDLAVVAGKDGTMYVVDRNNMGQYSAIANNVYQEFASDGRENFSSPIYFNGRVYIGPSGLALKAFSVAQAKLSAAPASQTAFSFGSNGTVPSASANGNTNGIVWALDRESRTLYAYDATDLTRVLYNTSQAAGSRDSFSNVGGHFITPMVANGKVYFGTGTTVAVFGLLP
jgi:hypothetical protein